MVSLSFRRLWVIYKRTALQRTLTRRERQEAQLAFYNGARGVIRVLSNLLEHGRHEELQATIRRHANLIERMRGRRAGAKRH
jgi:hypothetical protein